MNKELTKKLYYDFPKIFIQHSKPLTETAMCWGFQCGDGWFQLIYELCCRLQWDIDNNGYPQLQATTVKEKFGELRFYCSGSNDKQEAMIEFASHMSNYICEECGSNHDVQQTKGYIQNLCKWCRVERVLKAFFRIR